MLTKVKYLNLIVVYEFADTDDNCAVKMHATNIKFNMEKGEYEDYDSNKKEIKSLAEIVYTEEKLAQMIRVWIFRWELSYTSKDPKASPRGGYSFYQFQKFLKKTIQT